MSKGMSIDAKRTADATKRQTNGIIRLNRAFGVTPLGLEYATSPRPKRRRGLSKNRARVLRRRQAHIRRAILRSATIYEQTH